MANEERLRVIIDALNKTEGELGQLEDDLKGVDKKAQEAGEGMGDLDKGISGALESVTGLSIESLTLAGAITGVAAALVDSTKRAAEWGDNMGDLAQVTGGTVRDTSEMAAALELVGVQTGTLEQALKAMTANGLQVNMATLRQLSKEYQALEDPIERNEFLFKTFGKAGLEMAEIMGKSAEELDRLTAAARASGKVIGEEAAGKAEEFNLRVAVLTQKLDGLKIALGNPLISGVLGFTDSLMKANQETATMTVRILRNTGVITQEQAALRLAAIASGDVFAALSDQEKVTENVTTVTQEQVDTFALLRTMYTDASGASGEFAVSQDWVASRTAGARAEAERYAEANAAAVKALGELQAKQDTWASGTAGEVVAALNAAGVKGREYTAALIAADTVLGTSLAQDEAKKTKLAEITQAYADGKISIDEYRGQINILYAKDMPETQAAFETSTNKAGEFDEKLRRLENRRIQTFVDTIYSDIYTGAKGDNGPGKTGQLVPLATGGAFSAGGSVLFNEHPATRPEVVVVNQSGGGYVLTQQQAQAALTGGNGGGITINGGVNINANTYAGGQAAAAGFADEMSRRALAGAMG